MRVAFASTDGTAIDTHFGWAKTFYLYEVDETQSVFIEAVDSSEEPEEEHAKLAYKIETLGGADIMYCTQIGPTASKMVQSAGVYPVKVAEGEKIDDAVAKLQGMLRDNPPIWLLRIHHKSKQRSA